MMLILFILALFSYSAIPPAIASPAVISFDSSVTPNVTYNVYQNDLVIYSGQSSLQYDVDKKDGDTFYVTAVLDGTESNKSNIRTVPFSPSASQSCSSTKITVAKNGSRTSRPMRDANFVPTNNRVVTGVECESTLIKSYSATDSTRGYYFVTNAAGYRGIAICKVEI
ncbi:MAG: hypothetical protein OEM38_00365 [Gammaproteobacteria bacterium]|nr:hypothetical protein [Gammaproteobacteria bacterium]